MEALPGRPGNLTPEQDEKLRQLWTAIFQVCGLNDSPEDSSLASTPTALSERGAANAKGATEKHKRRRFFSRSSKGHKENSSEASSSGTATPRDNGAAPAADGEDKYGQNKQFYDTLASQTPELIRATIWSMVKHDHPDALVLRFLRARKWDVDKALVMLVSTMNWRANEMHVDDDIMRNGEGAACGAENAPDGAGADDAKAKLLAHDFMSQVRMGKSFLHGVDRQGRPICVVRVRLHHQGEQCEESLERYTVYIIETARMLLRPPIDTATVVFDMTDFSMANMDYTPVKFMIKCFEANYPECLASVLVHKAPWIFQGIWKIIRGWLDPVVAGKIHFTNSVKDVEEFIAPEHILKELEGKEDWEYRYAEPEPGENDRMKATATAGAATTNGEDARARLLAARELLYHEYEDATQRWIRDPDNAAVRAEREDVAARLRADYWVLDPFVRARSFYDRTGVLNGDKVDFYPSRPEKAAAAAPEPAAAAITAEKGKTAEVAKENGTVAIVVKAEDTSMADVD